MIPTPWPEAGQWPNNNVIGTDPQLSDPDKLDFTLKAGSPAVGYGCQTFASTPVCRPSASAAASRSANRVSAAWSTDGAAFEMEDRQAGARHGRSLLEVSGDITTDTVWDADTVRVTGDVTVLHPATLTVVPGARVVFTDHDALTIHGRLLAVGAAEDPIVFTTDEPGAFAPDSTTAGSWGGIRFPWTKADLGESRLEWCVIEYAKGVTGDAPGGALTVEGCSGVLVRNSVLSSNVASYGGAVACTHQAAPTFVNCLFEGNTTLWHGSAVYSEYGYPRMSSCTFAGNTVDNGNEYERTGVVHSHIGKPVMVGCIVWDNPSLYYLPGELTECKGFYTTYSCVEEGLDGVGNIDIDPLYEGLDAGEFSVVPWSPCVNAGPVDTIGLRLPSTDLSGAPRVCEGRIDMGCYEPAPVTGVEDAPQAVALTPPFPNPTRGDCGLAFSLPAEADASLRLYDVGGRLVRTLREGRLEAGRHAARWDGKNDDGDRVAAGVYLARLSVAGTPGATRKIVLVR